MSDKADHNPSEWLASQLHDSNPGTEIIEAELVPDQTQQNEHTGAAQTDEHTGATQRKERRRPRVSPRQKVLLAVIAVIGVLAVTALYFLGMRLGSMESATTAPSPSPTPAPSVSPTPSPSATTTGPLPSGEYRWDELRGGECLADFESAWQKQYTTVDCVTPHPAQLVFRGVFDDLAAAPYPGAAELQKRMNLLCTTASIINYSVLGTITDIQVSASFAADADEWTANREYFCFVSRTSGAELTESISLPQAL